MLVAALRPKTRLIVTVHGSNVMGSLLPISEIAAAARDRGIPYLVDASQTVGAEIAARRTTTASSVSDRPAWVRARIPT